MVARFQVVRDQHLCPRCANPDRSPIERAHAPFCAASHQSRCSDLCARFGARVLSGSRISRPDQIDSYGVASPWTLLRSMTKRCRFVFTAPCPGRPECSVAGPVAEGDAVRDRLRKFLYGLVSIEFVPCPVCGRTLKTDTEGGGRWHLPRPKGYLEAICRQQHGTDHGVPVRW